MAANFETVLYEKDGKVGRVGLNRPEKLNAYNIQMRDDLYHVLEAIRDDPEVRVVLLWGVGDRAFCVGADLSEFGSAPSQAIARRVRFERDIWKLAAGFWKPTVAALHGFVIGAGLEIALLCDFRIAASDLHVSMPETSLGMIPAAGGTQTLSRAIPFSRTMELLTTDRRLTADEALDWGLVTKIVQPGQLLAESAELAHYLAGLPGDSPLGLIKQAVRQGADLSLAQGLALERRLILRSLEDLQ